MRSQTPEPDLDFVGDTDRARTAHVAVNLRQIIRRKNDLAADARHSFRNVRSNTTTFGSRPIHNLGDVMRILCARLFVVAAIHAAVIIPKPRNMDPMPLSAP